MKIYLMHQTHTDIGYTDRQEKIVKYHIDYLKQAIKISEAIRSGEKKEWEGFVWNNETHWILETFLKNVSKSWEDRLIEAIKAGHIHLMGNYLNVTDLVDNHILRKYLKNATAYGDKIGVKVDTAVSMDINGWGFGYAQAFYDAGIRRFYTCIHNHHGFVPFERKHLPFYWETPNKNKILVWNGDVYNQGNVSRLAPDVIGVFENNEFKTKGLIDDNRLAYAKKWLDDYIVSVKTQGYDYDFLPLVTKGLLVDNAPPNPHIMEAIHRFNELYGDDIEIEMVGIDDFFDKVEALKLDLPVYRGDWTDWWSDGYMSSPKAVTLYREAQRNYHKILSLKENGFEFNEEKFNELEYNLMMFSEHTWGYFTSVSEPWNKMTVKLDARNELFASLANKYADELIDDFTESQGEAMKAVGRPMRYKIMNPFNYEREELIKLYINWWEGFIVDKGYELYDTKTNEKVEYQEVRVDEKARREVRAYVKLKPYESKVLEIRGVEKDNRLMPLDPLFTRDERYDFISPYLDNTVLATQFGLETPFVKMSWKKDIGLTEFIDKKTNKNLIRDDAIEACFTPIYEVSRVEYKYQFAPSEIKEIRKDFGRNRKIFSSERYHGKLINTRVLANGPLFVRVELKYELKGTIYSTIEITAYRDKPQIDISYICGKDTVWEPESMYLSLPLTYNQDETLWIEKTGVTLRPRIDQLPKTLTKFYTMQSGYSLVSDSGSLVVSTPDVPLLYLGSLDPGIIELFGGPSLKNTDIQYSWLMNNYWETNFATSLGGFYRFDYQLYFSQDITDEINATKKAVDLQTSFIVAQVGYINE